MAKARSLNKVMLIGNLTRDPMLRKSSNEVLVCTFGIATNTSWKDASGNTQERAEFHNIVAFNKLAEICAQVLSTGMLVFLEGEIRTRIKETTDGMKYYKTEIKLNDMVLLNTNDRTPIGVDTALKSGDEVSRKTGGKTPADDYADASVSNAASDEEFNSEDLF